MSEHTPGPMEKIIKEAQADFAKRWPAATPLIMSDFYDRAREQDAIRADMLAALEALVECCEGDCDTPGSSALCQTHFLEPPPCSVAVARAAIARARGEAVAT